MKAKDLIARLETMPPDTEVFAVNEYDKFIPVKHADFLMDDEFGSGPHVRLSEYGTPDEGEQDG